MAKGVQSETKSKVKLRLIELEVEGGNAVEGLRTLAAALMQQQRKAAPPRGLPGAPANGEKVEEDVIEEDNDSADVEAEIEVAAEGSRPTRTRAPRRPPVAPEPLDLDITTGKVPLAEFVQQTAPESDWKRYLVIAYWFKHHRKVDAINIRHIFTCYKLLKWTPVPADLGAPFREMKSKQRWFAKGTEAGHWIIGVLGENEVDALLKKA
jgi:hypothetical protein